MRYEANVYPVSRLRIHAPIISRGIIAAPIRQHRGCETRRCRKPDRGCDSRDRAGNSRRPRSAMIAVLVMARRGCDRDRSLRPIDRAAAKP
jgi:hypothetical protein